ncbi:MAG: hypothetical protein IKJ74_01465 [Clostridia bacterium]|nr:hypothetical protein [Clostridia bacterium]
MAFDLSELLSVSACRVIFAEDTVQANALTQAILKERPLFMTEIDPAFSASKRIGPFRVKNKKCIWKILQKTKEVEREGEAFLQKQMKALDLDGYSLRVPAALSTGQRLRASVLYQVLNHRIDFCFNDHAFSNKENGWILVKWMKDYDKMTWVTGDVFWITHFSPSELVEKMGTDRPDPSFFTFFTLSENKLTRCVLPKKEEKKSLSASTRRRRSAETTAERATPAEKPKSAPPEPEAERMKEPPQPPKTEEKPGSLPKGLKEQMESMQETLRKVYK